MTRDIFQAVAHKLDAKQKQRKSAEDHVPRDISQRDHFRRYDIHLFFSLSCFFSFLLLIHVYFNRIITKF